MPLILHIDTSGENASICLAEGTACLCLLQHAEQRGHAAWLHPAIREAFEHAGKQLHELNAVGITAGPGSYTGLRVGMAAAKGLCYALNIPLITVNTLEAMASVLSEETDTLLCPMIDARRMEVFTAVYNRSLVPVVLPCALMLDENSFIDLLNKNKVCFFGNGKNKFATINQHKNAIFKNVIFNASHLPPIINAKFVQSDFASLAYTEPIYIKAYYTQTNT